MVKSAGDAKRAFTSLLLVNAVVMVRRAQIAMTSEAAMA